MVGNGGFEPYYGTLDLGNNSPASYRLGQSNRVHSAFCRLGHGAAPQSLHKHIKHCDPKNLRLRLAKKSSRRTFGRGANIAIAGSMHEII